MLLAFLVYIVLCKKSEENAMLTTLQFLNREMGKIKILINYQNTKKQSFCIKMVQCEAKNNFNQKQHF